MNTGTEKQVEWGVYCENFVMIGLRLMQETILKIGRQYPSHPVCTTDTDLQTTVVLAVLWYSVRVRQRWCEERDLCTTDTDLQWCWLCCGTQLG